MDICFEGVGQVAATFAVDGENLQNLQAGMAVTLTGNGTVGLGDEGDALCGVVMSGVRGGAAAVQIGGAVKVGYSGTAPVVGWQELVCDGEGGVKVGAGDDESEAKADACGVKYLVMAVDTDGKTAVVML